MGNDRVGVAEAALILGTSQSWIRNLIREKRIRGGIEVKPHRRLRTWWASRRDVERYLADARRRERPKRRPRKYQPGRNEP